MGLKLNNLEKCFYEASINNYKYVGVKIKMDKFDGCEIIINPNENFDKKFDYYKHAYDENLNLKHAPGMEIHLKRYKQIY